MNFTISIQICENKIKENKSEGQTSHYAGPVNHAARRRISPVPVLTAETHVLVT
jgi:hypothetical protein